MDSSALNHEFGIPGTLRFTEANGLARAEITSDRATATVYLQGAHVTQWTPARHKPVLFLSPKTELRPGTPIRGGVPIAFPWFATDSNKQRSQGKPGPSHGFARIQPWTVVFTAVSGGDLHMTLALGPTAMSRDYGFDHFRLVYQISIGDTLGLRLTVANEADRPLIFEEALHTYFAVGDVHETSVTGLEPTAYMDKADGMREKPAQFGRVVFEGPTDRVYSDTAAACVIHDRLGGRSITNTKLDSATTVIFNPWKELPDLAADDWHEMLCVETANTGRNAVTLAPKAMHTMGANISVQREGA